jgi:hypothetical protein
MIYEEVKEDGKVICIKLTTPDEKIWWIPLDSANRDYNQYLAFTEWVKAGKKPNDFWNQGDE